MSRHYDTLLEAQRGPFTVYVEKTWEDLQLADCFDDGTDPDTGLPYFDIEDMSRRVDRGDLDWFMLRVRVEFEGVELAAEYVGGFLYEDAREVLKDGTAEDMISTAIDAAKQEASMMKQKFANLELDFEAA